MRPLRGDIEQKRCPACSKSYTEYGPMRDVFHHMTNQAKSELLARELLDKKTPTPHLEYLKKNYRVYGFVDIPKRLQLIKKR